MTTKITELNNELATIKTTHKKELDAEKQNLVSFKTDQQRRAKLLGEKTIYDNLDPDAKVAALDAVLNNELRSKGYTLELDEATGNFVIKDSNGAQAFDEGNKQLTFETFTQKTFAAKKLYPQNAGGSERNDNNNKNKANQGQNRNSNYVTPPKVETGNGTDKGVKHSGTIKSLNSQARQDLTAGSNKMV